MLRKIISRTVGEKRKLALKSRYNRVRALLIKSFFSYDGEDLKSRLRKMGVKETDTLLVHSNANPESGFKGAPLDVVNALAGLVGEKGNLLMVSIPFRGSAYDYLAKGKPFYKDRTISMMGLITEIFRRKDGVRRSLHPTHPVLAYGKDSAWIVQGHELCKTPCGEGTPFEKFRKLNGKILFYDVDFGAITFFHYVEDITRDKLPFSVYHDEPFFIKAYDEHKKEHTVTVYAFNKDITRDAHRLEAEMKRQNLVKYAKVGNSTLILVNAEDVVACQTGMVEAGNLPYDIQGEQ